jgi:membrane fusion protein, multidrug efflux system
MLGMHNILTLKNIRPSIGWILATSLTLAGCNASQEETPSTKTGHATYRTLKIEPQTIATVNNYDGTVEAVRQTDIAAQVLGEITALDVSVGEKVKKNQQLLRLDAQAASQAALASNSQLIAARAQLSLASQEYERQKQLYAKNYISQGALENAEAIYKSAKAQVNAQIAQTGVAKTQTNFHRINAPYDAVIADIPVTLGDMATPGKVLLTLYDASQLRVSVAVPQSIASVIENQLTKSATITLDQKNKVEITNIQILPAADQATHTRTIRLNLPKTLPNLAPGMHVTVSFPVGSPSSSTTKKISIPSSALVKHAEMTGVYVISQTGEPLLRQLRLGETHGDQVEVLSGLSVGEEVAIEPQSVAGLL